MLSFIRAAGIAFRRDARTTIRLWLLNPGSSIAAYAALTISIGATTSIFSIVNSLLISPLPIADSDHVVRLTSLDRGNAPGRLSLPDILDLKQRVTSVDAIGFYRDTNANLGSGDHRDGSRPILAHVLETDADLFQVAGVRMSQGRPFWRDANQPGHGCEAVVSWSFWYSYFNAAPIAGRTIRLNERPCQVDGVLPEKLDLPVDTDLWIAKPIDLRNPSNGRGTHAFYALAHLKKGVSIAAFNAELASAANQLSRENAIDAGLRIGATSIRDWISHDLRSTVLILFAAVTAVLIMACANVANLLLARSSARMREMSVRAAVGASRASLFQQLVTESILLALASSLSGLAISALAVRWIRTLPNLNIPRPDAITIDWRVTLFALLTAGITGLIFGALPAAKVSLTSLTSVLIQTSGRITEGRRQQMARKILLAVETALATVLLIGSLLLFRSFIQITNNSLGFQPDHLLTAYVSLNPARFRYTVDSSRLARSVLEKLKSKPGVQAAAFTTSIPLQGTSGSGPIQIEGRPSSSNPNASPLVLNTGVSPSFRSALKIPLDAGVDLQDSDDRDDGTAILVNSSFAKTFFPNENAVGKRLRYSPMTNADAPWQQIVGVIGNTPQSGPEAVARPELYRPLSRTTNSFIGIVLRTADDPKFHVRDIEDALHDTDPELPIFYPRTMQEVAARKLGSRSFTTDLLAGFAGIALFLASGGIFAVVAYSVSLRTAEIGVRIACGATQSDVLAMIMRQGLVPAFAGIAVGLAASVLLSRFLTSLLYGVHPTDLTSYAGTVVVLAVSSTAAALLPAWRAANVEPWRALRYE